MVRKDFIKQYIRVVTIEKEGSQPFGMCVCSQQFVNNSFPGTPTERCVRFDISETTHPSGDFRGSQVTAFADTVLHGTLLSQGTDCL